MTKMGNLYKERLYRERKFVVVRRTEATDKNEVKNLKTSVRRW